MIEILRRVIWAGCLFAAIWLALYTRPQLLRIYEVDLQKKYERREKLLQSGRSFDAFVAEETKNNVIRLDGPEWAKFAATARGILQGKTHDPEWKARVSTGHYQGKIYFLPEEEPVREIASKLSRKEKFRYLEFRGDGKTDYLGAVLEDLGDGFGEAPSHLAHPYRSAAALVLLAGLAGYILLPWRRASDQRAMYSRLRGCILPDFIGSMLGGVFFGLPIAVCTGDTLMSGFVEDGGYLGVTLVGLGCSVFGLVTWVVAAWYAAYEVGIEGQGLRITTLRGTRWHAFTEITQVDLIRWMPPRWMQIIGWIAAIASPRQGGAVLLGFTQGDTRLALSCRDGSQTRFTLVGLLGGTRIVAALQDARVPISEDVMNYLFDDDDPGSREAALTRARTPSPPRISTAAWQTGALVVVAIAAAAAWQGNVNSQRAWVAKAVPTPVVAPPIAQVREQDRILREMGKVKAEMDAALEVVKSADISRRAEGTKQFNAAQEKFEALHREFESLPAKYAAGTTETE